MGISPTIFGSTPNEGLITKDVYGIKDSLPKNNNRNGTPVSSQTQSMVDTLKSGASAVTSALKTASSIAKQVNSVQQTAERLKQTIGSSISGGLSSGSLSSIDSSIKAMSGLAGNVRMTVNNVDRLVNTTLGAAKSVSDLANSTLGNGFMKAYDAVAESAVVKEAISMANDLGITEVMDKVSELPSMAYSYIPVLKQVTPDALKSGNLEVVDKLTEKLGSQNILSVDPNAIKTVLNSVKTTANDISQYAKQAGHIKNTLSSIDNKWKSISTNGIEVSDLGKLQGISKDVQKVLSYDKDLRVPTAIANSPSSSKPKSIEQIKNEYYEYLANR